MSQRPIVIDDTDNRIQYNGQGWFQDNGSQDQFGNYGPTYKHTLHGTTGSNSLSFSFKGTSVRVMGTTNLAKIDDTHYDPSWECFVDNVSIGATTPFQYRENNWVMCEKNGLSDASHDLTMKVTITKGNTFWFDSVQYVPSPSDVYDTEVLLVDNHDPAIQWGSGWGPLGGGANVTSVHGSNARFDFTGTGLSWVGFVPTELAHAASTGSYTIDGGNPVSFSLNGLPANDKTTVYNQIFFTTPQLAAGPHSLVVTYNGDSQHTPLTLDFIYLTNKTLAAPPPTTAGTGSSLPSSLPSTSSPNGGNVSSAPGSQPSSNSPAGTGTDPFGAGAATNSPVGPSGASSPSNNTTSSGSKPPLGAIVGGVLGGIAILLLIALLAFFLRRRPRKERRVSLIDRSEPGFAPFMSTYDNTQPINPHFNPPPAPSSSTGSYDPYGGYVVASSHNGSTTSSAPAVQRSHPGHSQNQSLSHSDPASVGGGGYNWGAAAAGAGAGAGVLQPLRKDREAGAERLLYERELVHHQDSGVRLPAARPRVVEEIPPMYTLS